MRWSVVLTSLVLCSSAAAAEPSRPSRARPRARPPEITLALLAGVATALVPAGLGAVRMATGESDGARNVGFAVAGAGLALAPIVSHLALGEYQRAAAFGAVPVAAEIGMSALMQAKPDAIFHGTTLSRTTFALIFSADLFGAAVGLFDVMMAGERALPPGIAVAPLIGPGRAGLVIGGTL